jgi:O-antigen ligase
MLLTSVILPCAFEFRRADVLTSLFRCYTWSIAINAALVLNETPSLTAQGTVFGYQGYFTFKGYLGECGAVAILMSFYALRPTGWRRLWPCLVILVSVWLVVMSNSKGSLAFGLLSPVLAGVMIMASKYLRVSLGVVMASIGCVWFLAFALSPSLVSKISYNLYGDGTLTGRTYVWDFVENQMWRNIWFGWGFHSFWLVGPDAPSVTEAPAWITKMADSHNGFIDVKLDTGRVGYAIFILFILASVLVIGRVAKVDLYRAWIMLSLVVFVIITNMLETVWFYADPLWVIFILVVADAARYGSVMPVDAKHRRPTNSRVVKPLRIKS